MKAKSSHSQSGSGAVHTSQAPGIRGGLGALSMWLWASISRHKYLERAPTRLRIDHRGGAQRLGWWGHQDSYRQAQGSG